MLKEGCPTIVPSYLVIDCLILGLFFVAFILSLAPLILRNIRKSGVIRLLLSSFIMLASIIVIVMVYKS